MANMSLTKVPVPEQDPQVRNHNFEEVCLGYTAEQAMEDMGVIRYRHDNDMRYGYADGDLGRIKTQQAFLKAVVEQCLQIKNVARIQQLAEVFNKNVTTNLSIQNLLWFGQQAIFGGLEMENVNFVTMPCTNKSVWSRSYNSMQSYVVPNTDELVDLVNECFSPYLEDLSARELDIMYVNSDGTIGSSTGKLEDTTHNSAWIAHKSAPAETETPEESALPEETETAAPEETGAPGETTPPTDTGSPETSPSPAPGEGGGESTAQPSDTPEASETPGAQPSETPAATPTPAPESSSPDGPPEGIPIL